MSDIVRWVTGSTDGELRGYNLKTEFARHREILDGRRKAGQKLEVTPPRYDDVFFEGLEVLNGK